MGHLLLLWRVFGASPPLLHLISWNLPKQSLWCVISYNFEDNVLNDSVKVTGMSLKCMYRMYEFMLAMLTILGRLPMDNVLSVYSKCIWNISFPKCKHPT